MTDELYDYISAHANPNVDEVSGSRRQVSEPLELALNQAAACHLQGRSHTISRSGGLARGRGLSARC